MDYVPEVREVPRVQQCALAGQMGAGSWRLQVHAGAGIKYMFMMVPVAGMQAVIWLAA